MFSAPFLTDLDPRAAIKGSRDPLGLVPLWASFGRQVVGNLSTVSSSVRGFTTLLLGYYFAERVRERSRADAPSELEVFIKFEQLAGYVRFKVNHDREFRGVERVGRRLDQDSKVTLGFEADHQILANQKIYGLWGLFSVPARASGLLQASDPPALTAEARDFVEKHYIAKLTAAGFKSGRQIVDLLSREQPQLLLNGRDAQLAATVASLLKPSYTAPERAFYNYHLVAGGRGDRTYGRQPLLAELLAPLPGRSEFSMPELRVVIAKARQRADCAALVDQLESIQNLEFLLVPMSSAFSFLLGRDRQVVTNVALEITKAWGPGIKHINSEVISSFNERIAKAFGESDAAERITRVAIALGKGNYHEVIRLLLEHNAFVMRTRGSDPWVRLDRDRLDVRFRDETESLLPATQLIDGWRNTYFINSLKHVQATLGAA